MDVPPANSHIAGDSPERILQWMHLPRSLSEAKLTGPDLIAGLVTPEVQAVGEALASNVGRAVNLSLLPHSFYTLGRRNQLTSMAVNIHLGRSPVLIDATYWIEGPALRAGFRDGTIRTPFPMAYAFSMDELIRDPYMGDALGSVLDLMAQQLVMVWTAFESLAGDLWEACLNARPQLGYAALGAVPAPQSEEDADKKRRVKFEMPLSLLESFGFDVRNKRGTVLRRHQRWNFSSRREGREAYLTVFEKPHHAVIRAALDDKRLRWLVAVRNAIVHAAGKADASYAELAAGHPVLSKVIAGARVPIDWALCGELVPAGLACCRVLLQFVDGWMASNP